MRLFFNALLLVSLLCLAHPALAGDTVLAPDTTADDDVSNIEFPDDLYEPDYFDRKAKRQAESQDAMRAQLKTQAEAHKARRAAAMAADQEAIKGRADAVVSQPGDYATRLNALKAPPPTTTDPQTQPPAEEDFEGPQINPGPGAEGSSASGGTDSGRADPGTGTAVDTRSLLDQMMDVVQ